MVQQHGQADRELAGSAGGVVRSVAARAGRRGDQVIHIDALWGCMAVDIRAGADLLACVVQTLGAAQAHHGYPFSPTRGPRA